MSLPSFECPECGERRNLKGKRHEDSELVDIRCLSCAHEWTHDPWKCAVCGTQMDPIREPLLQKARGTQQSIIGYRVVKRCPRCSPPEERSPGWMSAS